MKFCRLALICVLANGVAGFSTIKPRTFSIQTTHIPSRNAFLQMADQSEAELTPQERQLLEIEESLKAAAQRRIELEAELAASEAERIKIQEEAASEAQRMRIQEEAASEIEKVKIQEEAVNGSEFKQEFDSIKTNPNTLQPQKRQTNKTFSSLSGVDMSKYTSGVIGGPVGILGAVGVAAVGTVAAREALKDRSVKQAELKRQAEMAKAAAEQEAKRKATEAANKERITKVCLFLVNLTFISCNKYLTLVIASFH
jgi:hypothetical protein